MRTNILARNAQRLGLPPCVTSSTRSNIPKVQCGAFSDVVLGAAMAYVFECSKRARFVPGLLVLFLGCNEPSPDAIEPPDTDGNDTDAAPGSADGSGGGDAFDGCLRFPSEGQFAYQHQCGGFSTLEVGFRVTGTASNNGTFGPFPLPIFYGSANDDDRYENPLVMACCRELESAEPLVDSPHVHSCFHDLVEQGCRSLVFQLRDEADEFLAIDPRHIQLNNVADWLADHQQECFEEFWIESGARDFQPTDLGNGTPSTFPDHTWTLPSSAETLNLRDIQLGIASPWISSIFIPTGSERLTCESQFENNDVSFISHDPDPSFTYDLSSGSATVTGTFDSSYVQASASFASASSGCSACSYVSHQVETAGTIDALVIDSDEPASISWATTPLLYPHRFRIALYAPIAVSQVGWKRFRAGPGAASFVLSLSDDQLSPILWAKNVNDLEIWRSSSTAPWKIKPFEIQYTDAEGNLWRLYISELTFE